MHFIRDKDCHVTGHYLNSRSQFISLPGIVWPSIQGSASHCPCYD